MTDEIIRCLWCDVNDISGHGPIEDVFRRQVRALLARQMEPAVLVVDLVRLVPGEAGHPSSAIYQQALFRDTQERDAIVRTHIAARARHSCP